MTVTNRSKSSTRRLVRLGAIVAAIAICAAIVVMIAAQPRSDRQ